MAGGRSVRQHSWTSQGMGKQPNSEIKPYGKEAREKAEAGKCIACGWSIEAGRYCNVCIKKTNPLSNERSMKRDSKVPDKFLNRNDDLRSNARKSFRGIKHPLSEKKRSNGQMGAPGGKITKIVGNPQERPLSAEEKRRRWSGGFHAQDAKRFWPERKYNDVI